MKLGVIGSGMIVNEVLPLLSETGLELSHICGTLRSRDKLEALANKFGAEGIFTDADEFLKCGKFDTVYVAVPNHLHYSLSRACLEAGKHVIVEKPLAATFAEAEELSRISRERGLILAEAISNVHTKNYETLRSIIPRLGIIKSVRIGFSKRSSRLATFLAGETPPVFDRDKCGGALMDLGVYNLSWLIGLFGMPLSSKYEARVERGIDLGGTVTLDYGVFEAVSVAEKDTDGENGAAIEGEYGVLTQSGTPNESGPVRLKLNTGEELSFDDVKPHRLLPELIYFREVLAARDLESAFSDLEASLKVSKLLTELRKNAGIVFPCDI